MNNIFPVHAAIISNEIIKVNLQRDYFYGHNKAMETLAQRLAETRKEKKLSQAQLAEKAGLKNQSIIGNLENGHRKTSSHIPAIAEALGVEPLWLSDGKLPKIKEKKTLDFDESLKVMLGLTSSEVTSDLIRDLQAFAKYKEEERLKALRGLGVSESNRSEETGKGKKGK